MRVVLLCGNCSRHASVARAIQESVGLAGLVVEEREAFIPEPPAGLEPQLTQFFKKHFSERASAELAFFGEPNFKSLQCPQLGVSREELNTAKVWEFVQKMNPDLVISYGVHKLTNETLSYFPKDSWNTHGGFSPQYRGVITHFWPSYMLEPQMTGITLHQLTAKLDAGEIIHQTLAPLVRGDGVHELACRTVQQYSLELGKVMKLRAQRELVTQAQKGSGKLWLEKDWRPEHLRLVYGVYNNRIVDAYLNHELKQFEIKPVSQLT